MSSSDQSSHTPLLNNPWFYGSLLTFGLVFFLIAATSPQIKDPWFWESNDRSTQEGITRGKLLKQLKKHPDDRAIGNPDAPVTITEYTDFQCPYCRAYSLKVFPRILRNYVQTGNVYYRVRHFPLKNAHKMAVPAAIGAECAADQKSFWTYKKLVMDNQNKLSVKLLFQLSKEMGLENPKKYRQCLKNEETLKQVKIDHQEGIQRGVNSTPTFFINEQSLTGARSYQTFSKRIQQALNSPDTP